MRRPKTGALATLMRHDVNWRGLNVDAAMQPNHSNDRCVRFKSRGPKNKWRINALHFLSDIACRLKNLKLKTPHTLFSTQNRLRYRNLEVNVILYNT